MSIYLDYNATTPIDPRVAEVVRHYLEVEFGNSGSRTHMLGQTAKKAVQLAREQVALPLGVPADDIVFTSGATEANNLAILGLEEDARKAGKTHIVTTSIEHKAALEPVAELERRGFSVTRLDPGPGGWVRPEAVAEALRPETILVSIMHLNNETGVVQPLEQIATVLKDHPAYLHVDAAQSYCKVEGLDLPRIDLVSISGHKIFGPKGVGALAVKKRKWTRPPLRPLQFGGGQERGLRSGTLPVMLIAGMGAAAELAFKDRKSRNAHAEKLSTPLREGLEARGGVILGARDRLSPFTTMFAIPGIDSEALLLHLNSHGFALSNGAACTSQNYKVSHVLEAMHESPSICRAAIRLSLCHLTTKSDITKFEEVLYDSIERIKGDQSSAALS